jgi:hypothetical protein
MAQVHFSDEILMAFADGELDESVAASVEMAMKKDPAIAQRIAGFMRSRRIVRSAFQEENLPDVPPELRAAVLSHIEHFEAASKCTDPPEVPAARKRPFGDRRRMGFAMAASIAVLAFTSLAYFVGRSEKPSPFLGPVALLSSVEVASALSEIPSGQDRDLSLGRIRVISTFRVANGSLCRELKLQAPSGASDAVACHDNGWKIRFAVESTSPGNAYVPSDGADLMESYLQHADAGEPLINTAEAQALDDLRKRP